MYSPDLVRAVAVTAELTGARFSPEAAEAMLQYLAKYSEPAVLKALERCAAELRFPLTLAAVLERVDDGHLGPEAAWALVGHLTEDDTVVWTEEIAAAFETARLILPSDHVAARMAFLEDYRQRVAVARAAGAKPRWTASLGHDPTHRAGALLAAVEMGRLSASAVQAMLPRHEWPMVWQPELTEGSRRPVADVVKQLAQHMAAPVEPGDGKAKAREIAQRLGRVVPEIPKSDPAELARSREFWSDVEAHRKETP